MENRTDDKALKSAGIMKITGTITTEGTSYEREELFRNGKPVNVRN